MTRSSSTPNVFLFTDPAVGHQHGYYDGWVGDRFHYTGMRQRGDQQFVARDPISSLTRISCQQHRIEGGCR
jgi:hypothetical protein